MSRALASSRRIDPAWAALVLSGAGLALAAAFAPLGSAIAAMTIAAACVLVWRMGLLLGAWCLFIASLPTREPLSVDVVGTATLYANDLLLLGMTLVCLREYGWRSILRTSGTFRLGAILAILAVGGLYSATRLSWGADLALHEIAQVASFYVAWHVVRTGRAARATLLAFVVGLIPAIFVGFEQSTHPLADFKEIGAASPAIVWDEAGNPRARIFSTFDHPLHFSHALSTGAGIGLGLLTAAKAGERLFLGAIVIAAAACNQFTYSIGGLLGTAAAFGTALFLSGRRWLLLLLPGILVALLLLAPRPLLLRVENSLSGKNPTVAARMITYYQTVQVLRDHPVLGVGWGSIRTALEGQYRVSRDSMVAFTAENYFLERALASGLVGLAMTIAVCVLFFRNARARPPPEEVPWPRTALLVGGVAFYVQAQVIPAVDPTCQYFLWTLFAIAERMRLLARGEAGSDAPTGLA